MHHGLQARLDERGAVVEHVQARALRQRRPQVGHRLLDALDHLARVLALQHDDHAGDDLAAPVARDGALARLGAHDDVGHVAQVHRRAVARGQDHALEVGDVPHQAHAAQVDLLPAAHDDAAAGVGVAALDGGHHVLARQPVGQQAVGIDQHLVLLHLPAEAVDLVHAGQRLQVGRHQPVLDGPQLHRAEALALDGVLEDLAQARADGAQFGLGAGRQLLARGGQPLEDHLPRPVGVGAVLEADDDLRQAGLRQRPHLGDARQAAHRQLDRVAHALLDVDRRQARRLRQDHHLRAGHVREGVDGQPRPGDGAGGQQGHRRRQHQQAVAQQPVESVHGAPLSPRSRRPFSSAARPISGGRRPRRRPIRRRSGPR